MLENLQLFLSVELLPREKLFIFPCNNKPIMPAIFMLLGVFLLGAMIFEININFVIKKFK